MSAERTDVELARPSRTMLVLRHAAVTRVTHWLNALCLGFLLLSGLQIFNAWPNLYWGKYGADRERPALAIASTGEGAQVRGFVRAGSLTIPTTGVLGVSRLEGEPVRRAFPGWLTLPSYQDLATGRRWHFFFAWCFVINGLVYLAYGVASGHLRRDLVPGRAELAPRHIGQEIADHARLRFPKGEAAKRYNVLQNLSYLAVIFVLLPLIVLAGLGMSPRHQRPVRLPGSTCSAAASPRARMHFAAAFLLVLFVAVHVFDGDRDRALEQPALDDHGLLRVPSRKDEENHDHEFILRAAASCSAATRRAAWRCWRLRSPGGQRRHSTACCAAPSS
jgi:thiosulfate reductase cytochrome b subunit